MQLGSLIRDARKRAGVSVSTLAERVGVAANTVYRWERGELTPGLDNIQAVATALGMRVTIAFD